MRVDNRTAWDTRALHAAFSEVYEAVARSEGRHESWARLTVEVVYSRSALRMSGWAYLGGGRMRLRVPSPMIRRRQRMAGGLAAEALGDLFHHELLHAYGFRHGSMHGADRLDDRTRARLLARWPLGIPERQPAAKPERDPQLERYGRVLAAIARWEAKARRAGAALRRLRRKRAYYERALTAAGKLPPKGGGEDGTGRNGAGPGGP